MATNGSSIPGSSKGKTMDVAALLRDLRIGEEDFDDLIIEEEVTVDEEPELLAVARVLTDKTFSGTAFEDTMRYAWSLAKKVDFRDVGNNTFILQLNCLGDWKKVVEEGPWLFRNWGMVIQGYDGYTKPSSLILDKLPIWIQIHDIPEVYLKKKEILQNLAGRVGKFIKVDTEGSAGGNFVRVRVELDVNKPLARFTSTIRKGAREVYPVKYEKIPKFCEICGLLGHEFLECGNGFHKEEDHVFGEWLVADTGRRGRGRGRSGGFVPRGGRGARAGYGFGRGRGTHTTVEESGVDDDEVGKNDPNRGTDKIARKCLDLDGAVAGKLVVNEGALVLHGMENSKEDVEMAEDKNQAHVLESPVKTHDKKRAKIASEVSEENPDAISAGPLEGYCREQ
jgi:hypothetical protein